MNAGKILFTTLFVLFSSIPAFSAWTEPVPVTIANTSAAEDWSPFLSFDGLTLYFARARSTSSYYGKIYTATRDVPSGPFTSVQMLDSSLNDSPGHQLCPWISPDNLRMYYHNEAPSGRYSLMLSERVSLNDPWPAGVGIAELNSLGEKLQAPTLSQDELVIIFCAYEITGGKGSYDLWMATRPNKNTNFTQYRNLSEINSEFSENDSSISPDGLVLYFDSQRNGRQQIFKATRTSLSEPFSDAVLMTEFEVPGISNSHPGISADGKELYMRRELDSDRTTRDIYVSYRLDGYYVDANSGDDMNNGTSSQTAFATIQKAIDTAPDGYKIFVKPGIYTDNIDFKGKAITLQGMAGPEGVPVLESADSFAVAFYNDEDYGSVLKNFVIRNSFVGIFIDGGSPTISNITLIENVYGIMAFSGANPDISNNIFWNNLNYDILGCVSRYSLTAEAGEGNIYAEPLFADANNGDYHLKSKRGRYWPEHDIWILDKVTSSGVDGGDPSASVSMEPVPNGGIINMGAYGGTAYASLSEKNLPDADFNKDGVVNESDMADLIDLWLAVSGWLE